MTIVLFSGENSMCLYNFYLSKHLSIYVSIGIIDIYQSAQIQFWRAKANISNYLIFN